MDFLLSKAFLVGVVLLVLFNGDSFSEFPSVRHFYEPMKRTSKCHTPDKKKRANDFFFLGLD